MSGPGWGTCMAGSQTGAACTWRWAGTFPQTRVPSRNTLAPAKRPGEGAQHAFPGACVLTRFSHALTFPGRNSPVGVSPAPSQEGRGRTRPRALAERWPWPPDLPELRSPEPPARARPWGVLPARPCGLTCPVPSLTPEFNPTAASLPCRKKHVAVLQTDRGSHGPHGLPRQVLRGPLTATYSVLQGLQNHGIPRIPAATRPSWPPPRPRPSGGPHCPALPASWPLLSTRPSWHPESPR